MYGLIHSALQHLVVEKFGQEKWNEALKIAGIPQDSFFSTRSYDDEITFTLAGAVSEVVGAPLDDCLELFGEYWLTSFAPQSYDMLIRAAGDSLFEFLENLNSLHDRISTTFVGYVPPSFHLQRKSETNATVEYRSSRTGMVPFVVGIIKGMQDRFNVNIKILDMQVSSSDKGVRALIELEVTPR
jgi:hypothetical protein